jgi:hypothetical protein
MIEIELKGELEARQKVMQVVTDLRGRPFLQAVQNATLGVQRDARRLAPVDTGRLRGSITAEVRRDNDTVYGVVGTVVEYSSHMEYGTKPHFPPRAAIETWAKRHGMNWFVVARAIAQRGLRGRKYMAGALEKNNDRIVRIIGQAVARIVNQ